MSCAAARSGCISCTCPYRGREHKTTACRYRRGDRFPPCRLSGAWPIGAPRVAVHVPGATPQPRAPRIRRARVHPTRAAYTPASAARVGLIGYPVSGCPWLIGVFLYVGIVYLSTCLPRCARRVSGVYLWLSTVYPAMRHSVVMTDVPCSAHVMRPAAASLASASRVCARRACVIPRDISMPVNLPSGRRLR